MIEQTVCKIGKQLETLVKQKISVARALDILEATTHKIEEIIAINTMREAHIERRNNFHNFAA